MSKVRVMTYNVRSCIGRDLRRSPERIARVIEEHDPDIIALQEIDTGYKFKKGADQAQAIARQLNMDYHFHPSITIESRGYGNAILSRLPLKMIRAEALPRIKSGIKMTFLEKFIQATHEPRGALWVEVQAGQSAFQVVTTHLGLTKQERLLQMGFLTSESWLNSNSNGRPVVFCGDLNDTHRSAIYRELCTSYGFADVQQALDNHKRKATFPAQLPLFCVDHIFVKGPVAVKNCLVPKTPLTKTASDHLPVIADLTL